MLIQRIKTKRYLYFLTVALFAASLLVISFHKHADFVSKRSCSICKVAKDISGSKIEVPFLMVHLPVVSWIIFVFSFLPLAVLLTPTQNTRASPPRHTVHVYSI